jgi:hypothetical protein
MRVLGKITNVKEKTKGKTAYSVLTIEIWCVNGEYQQDRPYLHAGDCVISQEGR